MEYIKEVLLVIVEIIDLIGVAVLLFGFVKIFLKYLKTEFKNISHTPLKSLQKIRCEMGIYILLGLDFLIVSDIIQTILDLSMEEIIKVSVLILLRTIISYFLGKEIIEIESIDEAPTVDENQNNHKNS